MRVGQSILRLEDRPLLQGRGRFAADLDVAGQVHMRVVRSPIASGEIRGIEKGASLGMPGVVAVWTAEDVRGLPAIDFRMTRIEGMEPYRQPVLARDHVRYVGEPIAVVFAEDPYLAEDAADAVHAELDELPVALDPTVPGVFHPSGSNVVARVEKAYGGLEAAFAAADHIVELELAVGRHSGIPMETRGALGVWDPGTGTLRMLGAAKVPHYNRDAIARMLGLAPDRVQLEEGHVGGGFGIRGELYPEDVLVCHAARRLGRAVKWIEDRREHLLAANHSRDQLHRIRLATRADGFILGIDDEFWHDQGAYVRTHGATVPELTAALLPGPYVVPAFRAVGHVVLTNKTPAGTYRAPGRYEGTFVRERAVDAVARELAMSPVEVRRRNLIGPDEMPFDRGISALGTDVVYDSGDYPALLDVMLDHVDYGRLVDETMKRRAEGELVGVGLGMFVEKSGLGPFDDVRVEIDRSGAVEVITGAASLGQGIETVIAQVCADSLGADLERITVTHGQTARIGRGMGSFATRTTVMTGSATFLAAGALRNRVTEIASDLLEADIADLVVEEGCVTVAGNPAGPVLTFADIATAVAPGGSATARHGVGLSAGEEFASTHMTYPYGAHLAVVVVDPETAAARLERFVVVYDVGRAINPALVRGQIVGAVAQGLGGALLEEFRFDDLGQPQAVSLADYLMPTAGEMPPVEVVVLESAPSTSNPLGVKGAGEGGITACAAAIGAAIDDALDMPGAVSRVPVSPDRLRDLLRKRGM